MRISILASGSSGNCFYVENKGSAVLIDAGISSKQIRERLAALGEDADKLNAIFVTHEHSDHTRGADVLARQLHIPVYATGKTINSYQLCSEKSLIHEIKNNETICFPGFDVEAFSKSHRAADPVSFNILNGKKISIITDLGFVCANVAKQVSNSDFLCLEFNHDLKMLEEGPYPYFLKKWIKSDLGHLSNLQAGLCVLENAPSNLKQIVLSHLSETNNTPDTAFKTLSKMIKERKDLRPKISISARKPTEIFEI